MSTLETARKIAAELHGRVGREYVAIRSAFISSDTQDTPPPMTQLLRGGRGGEVKLKLLLSMLWVAAKEPYDVTLSARAWAELLGLEDADSKGSARVNAAVRRLGEQGFLRVERRPGMPNQVFLLEETGTGSAYTHPGSYWTPARRSKSSPKYTRIPTELWRNGWIAKLSGPGLAMLLILLERARGQNFSGLWFSSSVAQQRYGLSEVTRRRGIEDLERLNLVIVDRAPIGKGTLATSRFRNTYTLNVIELEKVTPTD